MRWTRIACRVIPLQRGGVESPDRELLRHAEEGDNRRIIQKKWGKATAVSQKRATRVWLARGGAGAKSQGRTQISPRREAEAAGDAGDIVFRIPGSGRGPQPVEDIDCHSGITPIRLIRPSRGRLSPSARGCGRPRSGSEVLGRRPARSSRGRPRPRRASSATPTSARIYNDGGQDATQSPDVTEIDVRSFPSVRDIMAPADGQRDVNLLSLYLPN